MTLIVIVIYLGNGDGSFTTDNTYGVGATARFERVSDFDNVSQIAALTSSVF
jgi:hypothetical protein